MGGISKLIARASWIAGTALIGLGTIAAILASLSGTPDLNRRYTHQIDRALEAERADDCTRAERYSRSALRTALAADVTYGIKALAAEALLGRSLVCLQRHHEAEGTCAHAMSMLKSVGGADEHRTPLLVCMGNALVYQQKFLEAVPFYDLAAEYEATKETQDVEGIMRYRFLAASSAAFGGKRDLGAAMFKDAIADLRAFDKSHAYLSTLLPSLVTLYLLEGDYAAAKPFAEEALQVAELRGDAAAISAALPPLSLIYKSLGLTAQGEQLMQVASSRARESDGEISVRFGTSLIELSLYRQIAGDHAEEERLLRRALAIFEQLPPDRTTNYETTLSRLAALAQLKGNHAEAERLQRDALSRVERISGPNDARVARFNYVLGYILYAQHRADEAAPFADRALEIADVALNKTDPLYATILGLQSRIRMSQHDEAGAWEAADTAQRYCREAMEMGGGAAIDTRILPVVGRDTCFKDPARTAYLMTLGEDPTKAAAAVASSFETSQLLSTSSTAQALRGIGAYGKGDPELEQLARRRQALSDRAAMLEQAIVRSMADVQKSDRSEEDAWRDELHTISADLATLDQDMRARYPDFFDVVGAALLTVEETKALLKEGEALLLFVVSQDGTFVFGVSHASYTMAGTPLSDIDLAGEVRALRQSLSLSGVTNAAALPRFDLARSHKLYQALIAPLEPWLETVKPKTIIAVPDGALESLPLSVLVAQMPPQVADVGAAYRDTVWLSDKFGLSVLPSVDALRALRRHTSASRGTLPFIGIGDPLLGTGGQGESADIVLKGRGISAGKLAALAALPETADELRSLAKTLGASPSQSLYLRERASETTLKTLSSSGALKQARVIAFATHALSAGDSETQAPSEPGIVLTLPREPGEADDGFLTTNEAAALEMDADWVILSACNTAAPDGTPGSRPLSGLARAFFQAGARSLLVSHWPVESRSSALTTGQLMRALQANPSLPRATALSQAQKELRADPSFSHPAFWAPYIIVGEAG